MHNVIIKLKSLRKNYDIIDALLQCRQEMATTTKQDQKARVLPALLTLGALSIKSRKNNCFTDEN